MYINVPHRELNPDTVTHQSTFCIESSCWMYTSKFIHVLMPDLHFIGRGFESCLGTVA